MSADARPVRRALFVLGADRGATRALARALDSLGLRVPHPALVDSTSAARPGEPPWLVDFHRQLLRRANVRVNDARPHAWFDTGKLSIQEAPRAEALRWLHEQFSGPGSEIVLEDPRLPWFVGLWEATCVRAGVDSAYAIVLRPPAESAGARQKGRASRASEVSRAAGWINQMLHVERATRESPRALIPYADLLEDWTVPVHRLGERFGFDAVQGATVREIRRIHEFFGDPHLHQARHPVHDQDIPKALRVLMDETWDQLTRLVRPETDAAAAHAALDQIRLEYAQLYEEAERLTQSTALAARRASRRPAPPAVQAPLPPPVPEVELSHRVRSVLARRLPRRP